MAVLTPLVGVPLTAITLYLRALRQQSSGALSDLTRRLDRLDTLVDALTRRITDVERDSATKEEWIRESMLARRERQWLSEAVVRLETELGPAAGEQGLSRRPGQATRLRESAPHQALRRHEQLTGEPENPADRHRMQG